MRRKKARLSRKVIGFFLQFAEGQWSKRISMSEKEYYNRSGMWAFVFSMVFIFGFFIYIVAIHPGVDLRENLQKPPSGAVLAEAPVDMSKIAEPWVPNPDVARYGKKAYQANCAICHGNNGLGDGAGGQALNPKPRNLVTGPFKKGGGYLAWFDVATNGLPGTAMAPFGHLKASDRWAIVQFIDSITEQKSKDDPAKVAEFAKTAK